MALGVTILKDIRVLLHNQAIPSCTCIWNAFYCKKLFEILFENVRREMKMKSFIRVLILNGKIVRLLIISIFYTLMAMAHSLMQYFMLTSFYFDTVVCL